MISLISCHWLAMLRMAFVDDTDFSRNCGNRMWALQLPQDARFSAIQFLFKDS